MDVIHLRSLHRNNNLELAHMNLENLMLAIVILNLLTLTAHNLFISLTTYVGTFFSTLYLLTRQPT
jgi:hypothetical protein